MRGTAINANQKLNREGTLAATNLRFMGEKKWSPKFRKIGK